MDTNTLKPTRAQQFTGATANEAINSYRTIPDLLRDIAEWMDGNDVADTEFQHLLFSCHLEQATDKHHYSAILYYLAGDELAEKKLREIKTVSCGCCTNGCICVQHMDIPRGLRPQKCGQHSGTGEVVFLSA